MARRYPRVRLWNPAHGSCPVSARSGHRYPCPMPDIRPAVAALEADAVAMRRDLHEHAELSTEEHRTQAVITERLRAIGVDDVRAIADTGVTAIVRGAGPGPNILWRADGLPLLESTGLPFASTNGATHACGHDGHTAIALTRAHRPRSAWPARRYCPLRFSASRGTHRWGEAHDRSRGDGGPEGGPGLWPTSGPARR